jgi:hypothetical protein
MGKARNPDNDAFYLLNVCDDHGVRGSRQGDQAEYGA